MTSRAPLCCLIALVLCLTQCARYQHDDQVILAESSPPAPQPRHSLYCFMTHATPAWTAAIEIARQLGQQWPTELAVEILTDRSDVTAAQMGALGLNIQGLVLRDPRGQPVWRSMDPIGAAQDLREVVAKALSPRE